MSARTVPSLVPAFALALSLVLAGCAGPSDRYAFWRDNDNTGYGGHKPNLGDVPTPPANIDQTKAEMESMRVRMEQERDSAYATVMQQQDGGYYNTVATPPTDTLSPVTTINTNDLTMPMQIAGQPQQQISGNVVYNYGTESGSQPYVYGFSPVNIRATGGAMPHQSNYVSDDPSVTVDMSALGGTGYADPSYATSLRGEPVVYFGYGSARLSPNDKRALSEMAGRINNSPQSVVVTGYASKPTGLRNVTTSNEVNLKMSSKRAVAVMRELASIGVNPGKINVAAYGDTMAQGDPSRDQRVEIKINP